MKRKLDELEFNQVIPSGSILPGAEIVMGENMKLVEKSYVFLGDDNVLQTIKLCAEGFNPKDFEQD